ncbi:MAG: DUF2020 domain-containing protein [Actinobacteria bacterium]|nr:DUF2020 domain-containing protein [Actinomycetota bacterium]MBI3686242.1 DUF2020 domain-containing protein [Actinomycetota bacterium]
MRLGPALPALVTVALFGGCANTAQRPSLIEASPTSVATSPSPAPRATRSEPVVTRDGPCPYFDIDFAAQTIGQHLGRSTVTTARPYPGCTLYRPDGAPAVRIQLRAMPTIAQAQELAVAGLGPGANPVSGVGDRGTVLVVPDGTRLLVSRGRVLVDLWINQQSSLQASDLAAAALRWLGQGWTRRVVGLAHRERMGRIDGNDAGPRSWSGAVRDLAHQPWRHPS